MNTKPAHTSGGGELQEWGDTTREQAILLYRSGLSYREMREVLAEAGCLNADGEPPTERQIRRWVREHEVTHKVDLRSIARAEREDAHVEALQDIRDEVMDAAKREMHTDGVDGRSIMGFFKSLDIANDHIDRRVAGRQDNVTKVFVSVEPTATMSPLYAKQLSEGAEEGEFHE